MDPRHKTPSDAAGERVRDTSPPEEQGPTTPAPPAVGPDVNDIDSFEDPVDRFWWDRSETVPPPRR
jgi:hypothetical protein